MGRHIDASKHIKLEDWSDDEIVKAIRDFRESPDAPRITPLIARVMVEQAIIVANKESDAHGNTGRRTGPRFPGVMRRERAYLRYIVGTCKARALA